MANPAPALQYAWHGFLELDLEELYEVMIIRQRVFVVEQKCEFVDADGADREAHHLLGYREGVLSAYGRVMPPGRPYDEPSLSRILTSPEIRGQGYGRPLVAELIRRCERLHGAGAIRIQAQAHLTGFYTEFGFESVGDPYLLDGIWHEDMVRPAR